MELSYPVSGVFLLDVCTGGKELVDPLQVSLPSRLTKLEAEEVKRERE